MEGYINTADSVSVCIAGTEVEVDYEMNENNNAYQRAGKMQDGSNQNVENSSGRSGMLG